MGGDLVDAKFGSMNDLNFAYGLMARRYFHPNLAIRGNLLRSRLTGNDDRYERLAERGFRTQTPLTELSMDLEFDLFGHRRGNPELTSGPISPYFLVGVGMAFTNPKTNYGSLDGDALQDQNAEVSGTRFVLPVGLGLRIDMGTNWAAAVEVSPRATFSDYLDGVSLSGNPDKNDWYGIGSVQLWYKLTVADRDRDGIADADDACPDIAGTELAMGCPDRDNDSVPDERDTCPDIPGSVALAGCPDSDNDGVTDFDDECPTQAGLISMNGCPDSDGDGIANGKDECPLEAGVAENGGCPVRDRDNDGVMDDEDDCPDRSGPIANQGCPYGDADGDGIPDNEDDCPNAVGALANGGCPEAKVADKAQEVVDFATRNIQFATDKAEFLDASYAILDEVAQVMKQYTNYKLKIEGFTDSRGRSNYNQDLSESRARRCYDYLVSKGVPAARMQYRGFGETNPVASNLTEEGRMQNRRVEFSLFQ